MLFFPSDLTTRNNKTIMTGKWDYSSTKYESFNINEGDFFFLYHSGRTWRRSWLKPESVHVCGRICMTRWWRWTPGPPTSKKGPSRESSNPDTCSGGRHSAPRPHWASASKALRLEHSAVWAFQTQFLRKSWKTFSAGYKWISGNKQPVTAQTARMAAIKGAVCSFKI